MKLPDIIIRLFFSASLLIFSISLLIYVTQSSYAEDGDIGYVYSTQNIENDIERRNIVFYDADILFIESRFIVDIQREILEAQVVAEKKIMGKQNEYLEWEQKWIDRGPLLSSEEQQYMKEMGKWQEAMTNYQLKLQDKLIQDQTNLTLSGINEIKKITKEIALEKGYDFVLSYSLGQNIIYCNSKFDITDELVERMNINYND